MKKHSEILKMVFAALFLALAIVMPFLTGQIPEVGSALCPMHIPVILCGFVCGGPWGAAVGLIAPVFRSLVFSMPPMYPTAVCMALELAAYGAVSGILYRRLPAKKICIYAALLIAMVVGRLVWGGAMFLLMGLSGKAFGPAAFFAGAVGEAVPGILVQIVLIPVIVMLLEKAKILEKRRG